MKGRLFFFFSLKPFRQLNLFEVDCKLIALYLDMYETEVLSFLNQN